MVMKPIRLEAASRVGRASQSAPQQSHMTRGVVSAHLRGPGVNAAPTDGPAGIPAALREALFGPELDDSTELDAVPVKTFAWAPVSTAWQISRGLSIAAQLDEIRSYAREHGFEIVEEFVEQSSGRDGNASRPEFSRMLTAALGDPAIGAILVHDSSRFSRDSLRGRLLVRELRQTGVDVIFIREPRVDPETPFGVYVEALSFAKNEAYSRELAMHLRKGCRANVQTRDPLTGWCYKNGGYPPWGYRAAYLDRSPARGARPLIKQIWVLDETAVVGRPVHEWVRHCLVELAATGATLRQLTAFCDEMRIPTPRGGRWSADRWHFLLHLDSLLRYSGHGLWNVRVRSQQRENPVSEWVIVPNAHPAIITPEEARLVAVERSQHGAGGSFAGSAPCRHPSYLLGDGLFKCGRCGGTMRGRRWRSGEPYYSCLLQKPTGPSGVACTKAVSVPKELVEGKVLSGLRRLLDALSASRRGMQQINRELKAVWRSADRPAAQIPADSLGEAPDGHEATPRPKGPRLERYMGVPQYPGAGPPGAPAVHRLPDRPPQIRMQELSAYCRHGRQMLSAGTPGDIKSLARRWVERVRLDPERRKVQIIYRLPGQITQPLAMGTWCRDNSPQLSDMMAEQWTLPRRRRVRRHATHVTNEGPPESRGHRRVRKPIS